MNTRQDRSNQTYPKGKAKSHHRCDDDPKETYRRQDYADPGKPPQDDQRAGR